MPAAVGVPTVSFSNTVTLGNKYQVTGTLAITVSPATYATGGLVCNLNTSNVKASRAPLNVIIVPQSGYEYLFFPGTDNSNGKLKIYVQDAVATNPSLEMANGTAIPAAVSSDVITFIATYLGQN